MYKIIKAEKLNEIVYLMVVEAPMVAKHCEPGQFIIVKQDDAGERIPLTICDYDREAGSVTIVFQSVGASTIEMADYEVGQSFRDFVGPLGKPAPFKKWNKISTTSTRTVVITACRIPTVIACLPMVFSSFSLNSFPIVNAIKPSAKDERISKLFI